MFWYRHISTFLFHFLCDIVVIYIVLRGCLRVALNLDILYDRNEQPFGQSWEEWAALWCRWMFSIPKKMNPTLDISGKYCSINQNNENAWFLTGTYGNINPVKRKCSIPAGKAIFFPILQKEDSFAEDADLKIESELIRRSTDAINELIYMQASLDGVRIPHLADYRVLSKVFDLEIPVGNLYDLKPGLTRSVCDGYWLFLKPLEVGTHHIGFEGEVALVDSHTLAQLRNADIYGQIHKHICENFTFRLKVSYELKIKE
jgi:hypothetical protein